MATRHYLWCASDHLGYADVPALVLNIEFKILLLSFVSQKACRFPGRPFGFLPGQNNAGIGENGITYGGQNIQGPLDADIVVKADALEELDELIDLILQASLKRSKNSMKRLGQVLSRSSIALLLQATLLTPTGTPVSLKRPSMLEPELLRLTLPKAV